MGLDPAAGWLLGTRRGGFARPTVFAAHVTPYAVVMADFNGDGLRDLAAPNANSNDVSILLGTGSGSFGAATNFAVGSFPTSLAAADLSGDGFPDLVIGNAWSDTVSVLLSRRPPCPAGASTTPSQAGVDAATTDASSRASQSTVDALDATVTSSQASIDALGLRIRDLEAKLEQVLQTIESRCGSK